MSVVNEHAPLKKTFVSGNQVPYINIVLCKAGNQWNCTSSQLKLFSRHRCDKQNGNKIFFQNNKSISLYPSYGCGNKIFLKKENCIRLRPQDATDMFNGYLISICNYDVEPHGVEKLALLEVTEKHDPNERAKVIPEDCSSQWNAALTYTWRHDCEIC